MQREENCGCNEHGRHHGVQHEGGQESHGEDCGCGGHGDHGMHPGGYDHGGCGCDCHQHHGAMGFHRRFIPREEIIARLEEYLKQLQAEAKGVEERLVELKKEV